MNVKANPAEEKLLRHSMLLFVSTIKVLKCSANIDEGSC